MNLLMIKVLFVIRLETLKSKHVVKHFMKHTSCCGNDVGV